MIFGINLEPTKQFDRKSMKRKPEMYFNTFKNKKLMNEIPKDLEREVDKFLDVSSLLNLKSVEKNKAVRVNNTLGFKDLKLLEATYKAAFENKHCNDFKRIIITPEGREMITESYDKLKIWSIAMLKMDRQLIYLILDNFGVKRFWNYAQIERNSSALKEILKTDLGKAYLTLNIYDTYG